MKYCFIIIFVYLSFSSTLFANSISEEVYKVADSKISYYINRLSPDMLKEISIESVSQLDNVTLGTPCLLYSITPSSLENYSFTNTINDILTPTTMWYIPVLNDKKPIAMLIVDKVDKEWKTVSFGHYNLASEWNKITKQFSKENSDIKLIVMYQAKSYLFSLANGTKQNLTPLNLETVNSKKTTIDKEHLMSVSNGILWLTKKIN